MQTLLCDILRFIFRGP